MSWLEEELTKKQAKKQKITGSDVAQCLEEEFPLASGRLPYWLPGIAKTQLRNTVTNKLSILYYYYYR